MATKHKPATTHADVSTISIAELLNSTSITSSKLSGSKNYLPWAAAMKTFLISKERLKYIEKEKHEGAGSVWAKEDAQVRSWLWNSMEPHVSADVMLLPAAYAVWVSIKETYGHEGNIQRIYELCEDVFLTKQGSRPLHEHYSFVKAKEELNLYQPYPGDLATWKRQREELKVISFLSALGPHYESAKNQILTGIELPTLNATFSRLSRMTVESDKCEENEENVALIANAHTNSSPTRSKRRGRASAGRGRGRAIGQKEDSSVTIVKRKDMLKVSVGRSMENLNEPPRNRLQMLPLHPMLLLLSVLHHLLQLVLHLVTMILSIFSRWLIEIILSHLLPELFQVHPILILH